MSIVVVVIEMPAECFIYRHIWTENVASTFTSSFVGIDGRRGGLYTNARCSLARQISLRSKKRHDSSNIQRSSAANTSTKSKTWDTRTIILNKNFQDCVVITARRPEFTSKCCHLLATYPHLTKQFSVRSFASYQIFNKTLVSAVSWTLQNVPISKKLC